MEAKAAHGIVANAPVGVFLLKNSSEAGRKEATKISHRSDTTKQKGFEFQSLLPPPASLFSASFAGLSFLTAPNRSEFGSVLATDETAVFGGVSVTGSWFVCGAASLSS